MRLLFLSLILLIFLCGGVTLATPPSIQELHDRFQKEYEKFVDLVNEAHIREPAPDCFLLELLGEELGHFQSLVSQNSQVFDATELLTVQSSVELMLHDVRILHGRSLEVSHNGQLEVVWKEKLGNRGRPRIVIDRDFLAWAYRLRSSAGIARFLGISRTTLKTMNPALYQNLSKALLAITTQLRSRSLKPGSIDDEALDMEIRRLHMAFPRAGLRMLDGMLRQGGIIVPQDRISLSLYRVDPVKRVFDRVRLKRRGYSVPGPNSLWHHDGQHGLIRWGVVIHGFIDGFSRLVTGLRASPNNLAATVLSLFLESTAKYGIPSRLRGDHGVENVLVAAFMESTRGERRGSYIWGRSVHNTRIERLWADVTIGVGDTWHQRFTELEVSHDLQINNPNHLWLLHHLFLPTINFHLQVWARSWNFHPIAIRNSSNQRPEEMFGFGMLLHGLRGEPLAQHLSQEELELYGIDWDAYQEESILRHLRRNYADEGASSWLGRRGPPSELNEVNVMEPLTVLSDEDIAVLDSFVASIPRESTSQEVAHLWRQALIISRILRPHF
ncbi:hypothetical protein D9757_010853 [Collybiopsis confluens]|uniref:Integrase catalytic domain-containing protein n=1 Tax=Collybiopsis confluens TaxID=2823264 RepID=A0A8H5LRQ5_9AGAR|nr:hypothetical protein D9757_010853 [Collybiopsis confluens]